MTPKEYALSLFSFSFGNALLLGETPVYPDHSSNSDELLERLTKDIESVIEAAVKEERDACATVCDQGNEHSEIRMTEKGRNTEYYRGAMMATALAADLIRKRSK